MPGLGLGRRRLGERREVGHVAGVELDPFRPGATERVAADHVAEDVDDVPADVGAGGHDQEADQRQRDRDGPVGGRAGAEGQRDQQEEQGDDHQRRVERRAGACRAVGVCVVGGAGHGGREHEQDRRHERDVGGRRLVQQVKDDDQQERADRDVRGCRVKRVPEPDPVEEVLEWPDRSEEGAQPAVVEIAERRCPSVLRGDEACDQTTHSNLPDECIHRASTVGAKFGDNFLALGCKFVDKPVVATRAPTVHFVLPEGAD